ncbi:hypothetical protein AB0C34_18755 [Nocardia sp. NPDC049220]|uniref:hypothetical protein n=1 Tax=Nocardia sp. NPDC049220 TaxID=3155273 RepID=UPI003408373F
MVIEQAARVEKGQSPQVRIVDIEALCRFLDLEGQTTTALEGSLYRHRSRVGGIRTMT